MPDDDARVVGSSHGWLALLNKRNYDLFLSNPISRRHIKLPPLRTLPDPEWHVRPLYVCVKKVIISGSPDEEECRAVLTFGVDNRLAFCWPGRSTEWTPFGYPCSGWDLTGSSARMDGRVEIDELENYPWGARSEAELQEMCREATYLVFAEHSNQLFLVTRHIMERMGPDGSYVKDIYYGSHKGFDESYPYKTIGFDVYEIDREDGKLRYKEGSLDGLAMFVGINHSCAISTAEFLN